MNSQEIKPFEPILSGILEMDKEFDSIRLGDNVVFQVDNLESFKIFCEPYVEQAVKDGRRIVYVRFASHEPLVSPDIPVYNVHLSHLFEKFTVEIYNLITKEGKGAFYVFDCLSELQTAWATDLMMGNFFRVICPYLFKLDTVAFFPVLRSRHSSDAIAKIRQTTQLFIDVYTEPDVENSYFVQPLKVWNRYSSTMFLPHRYTPLNGKFLPLTGSADANLFFELLNINVSSSFTGNTIGHADSWDLFFAKAAEDSRKGIISTETCQKMAHLTPIKNKKDEEKRI